MRLSARRIFTAFAILLPFVPGAFAQSCNTVGNTTTCTAANGTQNINTSTRALGTYPLQLNFSGLTGTISNIQLTVNNLTTNSFNAGGGDFQILLVSPSGEKLEVLSQYCNDDQDITGKNLTFADSAAGFVSGATLNGSSSCGAVASGTFKPTAANEFQLGIDTLPSPAPSLNSGSVAGPQGTGTLLGNFTGNPNGNWLLYVAVVNTNETASIGGASTPAWSLAITMAAGASTTTTLSLSSGTNPSLIGDSLTFHAVVSPTPSGGTVAFKDNGATISGCGTAALTGGTANCTTTGLGQGAHDITAVYSGTSGFGGSTSNTLFQGVNHPTTTSGITATSGQYCNTGGSSVTVAGASQTNGIPFSPYPSPIFVGTGTPSLSGIINTITIDITSYQSNEPQLDALMLVGPNGKAYEFMSFVNGGTSIGPLTIHFSDSGASGQLSHSSAPTNGNTYQPTAFADANPDNYCTVADTTNNVCDSVLVQSGAPNSYDRAPGRGTATLATEFGGITPNGTWQLFAITLDGNGHSASIGSWCLNITDTTGDATTTVLTSGTNPSATNANVTFTATITDTPHPATVVTGGTVAFTADGNIIAGCSAVAVSSGTAQCITNALNEGAHTIQATYSGTASFGTSSGSVTQRVNTATTGPAVSNQTTYTYCDPGPVNAPAGEPVNAIRGIGQPWPSEINVTNLPGTLNKATVTLNNFVFTRPDEQEMLLVPPTGAGLDFLSILNTITPVGNPGAGTGGINFTVADGGSSPAGGVSSNGTFAPYSGNNTHTYTNGTIGPGQTGPPGGFAFAAPGGSSTLANMIGGGGVASTYNGNGIWSLYMEGTLNGAFGGALSGWCVNLTINPPVLTISKTHSPSKFKRTSSGTITVTVGNSGPGSTGGTITVTDTLPTGFTFKQMDTANGWSCSGSTTVTCTNAAVIAQGGNSQFSFDVNVGTTAATSSVNNISAAGGGDISTRTNTDTIPVIGTDLSITKTHVSDFFAGQIGATYTIKVLNNGPADTDPGETITVTDSIPGDLTPTAISGGPTWTCSTPPTLMCTSTTQILNGGSSAAITLTVNVAANPSTNQVTNSATVAAPDDINIGPNNDTANDITNINRPPTIAKAFSPAAITVNGTSTLTITITNPSQNLDALVGLAFVDALPTGVTVAAVPALTNSCAGTPVATANGTSVSLSGGTVALNSSCAITVAVTSAASGIYSNTIPGTSGTAVSATNGGTGASSNTATLTVASPPTVVKTFNPTQIVKGTNSLMTIQITNPNVGVAFSGVAFTDTLPAGLTIATPNGLSNACNGTPSAVAGSQVLSLTGGTIAANASCTISVNVTGVTEGSYTNSVTVSSTEGGNATPASAVLKVVTAATGTKSFGAPSIPLNGNTTLVITLTNPVTNPVSLTGVGLTDTLTGGLTQTGFVNATGSCTNLTHAETATSITLSTLTLPAGATCTITYNVQGTAAGAITNTTSAISSTEGGNGTAVSANLTVVAPPTLSKAFGAPNVAVGGSTSLTLTITNPTGNTVALTGVAFTDTLPAGLVVATPNGLVNTCGGTPSAVAGTGTVSLTNGTVNTPAGTTCTVTLNVTGTTSGAKANTVNGAGTITSTNGGTGVASNTATLNVANPPTISKAFGAGTIPLNGSTSLSFTVTNPATNTISLTGVNFTDTLPAGLVVATPNNLTGTCGGGTITATAGSGTVSLATATLASNTSCTFSVNVTGTTAGAKNNSVVVGSTEGGQNSANPGTATVTVVAPPTVAKAFSPTTIPLNSTSTLTFTVANPNSATGLTNIAFTDTLPAGVTAQTSPIGGTCVATNASTTGVLSFSAISLASNTSCTITVTVTGTTSGDKSNTTSAPTSTEGGTGVASNTAVLSVVGPPGLTKVFNPAGVAVGGTVQLIFTVDTVQDTSTANVTNIQFTDTLPAGVVIATPNGLTGTGFTFASCITNAGPTTTPATVTAVSGTSTITVGGGFTMVPTAKCQFAVNVTASTPGVKTNTTSAPTSTSGGTGVAASANLTVANPPTISKAFGAATIPLNGSTTLSFTISNPAVNTISLTGVNFTDTLPSGLVVSTPSVVQGSCGGGTISAVPGNGTVSLTGATLGTSASCTFSVNVTGTTAGVKNNSVIVGSTEGGQNSANPGTASVTVVSPPTISKAFSPTVIPLNSTSTLTFTLTNTNATVGLTNVSFTDTLPSGVTAQTSPIGGNCIATNSSTTGVLSFSGIGIGSGASCTITVTVTGTTSGDKVNITGAPTSTEGGTGVASNTATLSVVGPPGLAKAFNPSGVAVGGTVQLIFTVDANQDTSTANLTNVAFSDALPSGVLIATPNGLTGTGLTFASCLSAGGPIVTPASVTATAGTGTISVGGGFTLVPGGKCQFAVNVTASTPGVKTNTTTAPTSTSGGTGTAATANLTVANPPTISKAFGAGSIPLNGSTSLSFTISNPAVNTVSLTGVNFTDSLPSGLVVATPSVITGSCGGGTITATAGSGTVSLAGATLATSASCTFSVNITGTTAGVKNNSVIVGSNEGGQNTQNPGTASITVVAPPTISKAFNPTSIAQNSTTLLTLTLTNPNTTVALTGVTFSDTLPAGLSAAPASIGGTCAGTNTSTAGVLHVSNISLAASASCTVTFTVTGTATGDQINTASAPSSTEGGTGVASNPATVNVVGPPVIGKVFGAPNIPINGTTTLTITINNAAGNTVSEQGVAFTDNLPSGLVIATPNNLTNTCNGTATATAGTTSISLTGGTVAAGGSCVVALNVTGTSSGVKVNTTSPVTSTNGGTGNIGTASISVASPPNITKQFGAAQIPQGTNTTLAFSISNPAINTIALTGINFTDSLPAGLVVATPSVITGSCGGGTITATAGSGTVSLAGATLATNGSCTFSININGATAGVKNNSVIVGSTEGGPNTNNPGTASITVVAPPTITKAFAPTPIPQNTISVLTFVITNPNATVGLSSVAFADTLPAGVVVASPSGLTNSCNGTVTAGAGSIGLTGGSLGLGASCTITLNVTGTSGGDKLNTTGPISSLEGGTGATSNTALLQVVAPPVISKAFGVPTLPIGSSTSLTFTITNPAANTLPEMGVQFSDTLPGGLVVSTPNGLTGSCGGGTITATAGSGTISLTGATLGVNTQCTFAVNVTGTTPGLKTNNTSPVSSQNGGPGNIATATIQVAPADMTVVKTHQTPMQAGDVGDSWAITVLNVGLGPTLGTVTVSDTPPTGYTPTAWGGPGWTCSAVTANPLTCTRNDVLPAGGIYPQITLTGNVFSRVPQTFINTVTVGGGGETNLANDTATDNGFSQGNTGPNMTIAKTHTGNFVPGQTGAYTITVSNSGTSQTTAAVTVTDPMPSGLSNPSVTSATGWNCGASTAAMLSCTRSDALAAGASYPPIQFNVNIAANASGNTINRATVAGGGELDLNDDTASDTVNVSFPMVTVTVGTSTPGLSFIVDTNTYTSTQTFNWVVGSVHTLSTTTPQFFSNAQWDWFGWSDGGAITHQVTATTLLTNYTANFSGTIR